MNEWRGIPRKKIPWYPTIAADKCIGCRTCVDFCKNGVLAFEETSQKAVVSVPFNCVVECSTCGRLCPEDAISFPEPGAFALVIRRLLAGDVG